MDKGINVVKTEVGDKNVLNALRSSNSNFGAEPSGHIIMTDYVHSSDALVAADVTGTTCTCTHVCKR